MRKSTLAACLGAVLLVAAPAVQAADWTLPVKYRTPAFDPDGTWHETDYDPLPASEVSEKWDICVLYPHTKDPYYLAMTYGAVQEARAKDLSLTVYAAGGYTELPTQISQMEDCVTRGADGMMMVAISATGLNRTIERAADQGIPLSIAGGDVESEHVATKAQGQWIDAGRIVGEYLNERHAPDSEPVQVLWMAGPEGPRWSRDAADGVAKTVADNDAVEIVKMIWGDSGKAVQIPLIEDALQAYPDIDYIGGIAPAIEGAIQVLKEKDREDIELLSFYMTPEVEQAVREGDVLGTVTDFTAAQARVAIDQLVRTLEGKEVHADLEPGFKMIDSENIDTYNRELSLPPKGWEPIFQVE